MAARVGARQVPSASPGLIRDAVRRLDALWGLSAFARLRESASGPAADVRDDLEFTTALDGDGPARATVFHGGGELAFRDRKGRWNLIAVGDASACPARQHLRLLLAAKAWDDRGLGPIARGWLVRHGPDGLASEEVVDAIGDGPVARVLAGLA